MAEDVTRRRFVQGLGALGAASTLRLEASAYQSVPATATRLDDRLTIGDHGWSLWLDREARWEEDEIFLPGEFALSRLAVNPPSGGWNALYARNGGDGFALVDLPVTVEQHFWGHAGKRSYTPDEYNYAANDAVPQNGAYQGVSWLWRSVDIPSAMAAKRILLQIRSARMRAEVYLNERLVGYSIMEELPFECDLTEAALPGAPNRLAIRITNPGGCYDWRDHGTIRWGRVNIYRSHGFGGVDRELTFRAVPLAGHIDDVWVLNKPEPRTVEARVKFAGVAPGAMLFEVLMPGGECVASAPGSAAEPGASDGAHARATLHVENARIWDLHEPELYLLRLTSTLPDGERDVRVVTFGFRWFAPGGLGENAIFRLNGRRIKIYTAISWGYWGHNGLFPTRELAEREVTQAKRLNLNCLNFHRNLGKEEVLRAHDRLGLLRYMEPGGGKLTIGKLPPAAQANVPPDASQSAERSADEFLRRFMLEKCRRMVRAFRSHPSLIQYTLQNELTADLKNPESLEAINIMHAEDPSRCVVLNDGFVASPRNAAQAWYEPYKNEMHRSDREPFGGWWNNHQGAADQWYDRFYKDSTHYTYREPLREALVEFGEMEGCAVADNHSLMIRQIEGMQFGGCGKSYDLEDHREIAAAYEQFIDCWGFRSAFSSAEALFHSLGTKCYESWQQYLENVRICDEVDFAAISGWESTAIENHSGIVDNLRNFKGNPDLIARSLLPIRPVLKQHALCYATSERALFDIYLLNESGAMPGGKLRLEMIEPDRKRTGLGSWNLPAAVKDRFTYTIQTDFRTPELTKEGVYRFLLRCEGVAGAACLREIWVTETKPKLPRPLRVAVSGVIPWLEVQLANLQGVEVAAFEPSVRYDVIVASGIMPESHLNRSIGVETGLEATPIKATHNNSSIPGSLPVDVLTAVRQGTPLLAAVPNDTLADGVAKQLAELNAFVYRGQVGGTRAPWMGNWMFVREHETFNGLPVNRTLGVHYQADGQAANGLLIDRAANGSEPEVIMGYSRDHDRNIGAASFICHIGKTPVLVHRSPSFSAPLQARWLANTLACLTSRGSLR